ncbi:hypothetical protein [Salibacterium aidingense]|uniref:hypothetical protein n=1 Tax=Salibacterium aidingense TaxID=384933 RepID=UPI003BBE9111
MAKLKVILDPGHGGRNPRAVGNGLQDFEIIIEIRPLSESGLQNNKQLFNNCLLFGIREFKGSGYTLVRILY